MKPVPAVQKEPVRSTIPTLIQALLHERFDLRVNISQINRVRAALGISNHRQKH
jgi:hypothetical protein